MRFTITGQGYTGTSPIDVTEMTLNDQTGVYEYWTPISASELHHRRRRSPSRPTVYGNDGGVRDKNTDGGGLGLDPLPLVVNATGKLPQVRSLGQPRAATTARGAVNDSTKPVRHHRPGHRQASAATATRRAWATTPTAASSASCPAPTPAATAASAGPIACDNEWVTITTAAGGTAANTILLPGGIAPTRKIAVRGITLSGGGTLGMGYSDRTPGQGVGRRLRAHRQRPGHDRRPSAVAPSTPGCTTPAARSPRCTRRPPARACAAA